MTRRQLFVNFNVITSIGSVANLFFILIWGEGFTHLSLTHHCDSSEIFSAGFEAGPLQFITTQSDQLISHQSFTTIKICFYGIRALSLFFQSTAFFHQPNFITLGISIFIWINLQEQWHFFHHIHQSSMWVAFCNH